MSAPAMPHEAMDQIHRIAEILAGSFTPAALRRMLTEHTPDGSGHCKGCWLPTTATPVWPCRLWEIGNEAERLRGHHKR